MRSKIFYTRLGFLPVLLAALLIQYSCSENDPAPAPVSDSSAARPDTSRPMIAKPDPDATIIDSLTHDFGGVWIADSARVAGAATADEGIISCCSNGKVRYRVYRDGPILNFSARQVWIDRQHVHIDMFLDRIDGLNAEIPAPSMPVPGKLFATADLVSDSRMNVLWYPRDFIKAIRGQGTVKSPEAFPAMFYYTARLPECR